MVECGMHQGPSIFYLVGGFLALDCATRTGHFAIRDETARSEARREMFAACQDLEAQIAEEQAAIKKEAQFKRQVEHNVRIKQMEKELEQKVTAL